MHKPLKNEASYKAKANRPVLETDAVPKKLKEMLRSRGQRWSRVSSLKK